MNSILCVPLHRDRFCEGARRFGASRILWDLEDSVPEAEVGKARWNARRWVRPGDALRIRDASDLGLAAELSAEAWVPKVDDPSQVPPGCVPILETPDSVLRARAFAHGAPGLAFGEHDLMAAIGGPRLADWCRPFVSMAAGAEGIPSYDSPCASLVEEDVLRAAWLAMDFGFTHKGAMCPSQVAILRGVQEKAVFHPGDGVFKSGMAIVGPPMRKRAERCLG